MYTIIQRRLKRVGQHKRRDFAEARAFQAALPSRDRTGQRQKLAEQDRTLQKNLPILRRMEWQTADLQVPTYVLVGFLGSGKTTLLNELIDWCLANGLTPGLVINEFGQVSIDGQTVQQAGVTMTELSNGCICCTAGEDFVPALIALALNPAVDLILVEATGLADPADMLDTLTDPALWRLVEVGGIISVVDTSRFMDLVDEWELVRHQVEYADLLVLSKEDLMSPADRAPLQAKLTELAPHSRRFEAINGTLTTGVADLLAESLDLGRQRHNRRQEILGRVSRRPIFSLKADTAPAPDHNHDHTPGQAHGSFHTFSLAVAAPVERAAFEAFLQNLPPNVYRAKGFVRLTDDPRPYIFQHTPGQVRITSFASPLVVEYRAVFIGQNLDEERLKADLEATIVSN